MRIYYPLNPEDAPTAAELAAEAPFTVVAAVLAETDEDGWTVLSDPYDPEDIF